MSLVAYGSSDESEDDEITPNENKIVIDKKCDAIPVHTNPTKLHLTEPKYKQTIKNPDIEKDTLFTNEEDKETLDFNILPTPKDALNVNQDDEVIEEDDVIPIPVKEIYLKAEKPPKKNQSRAKIIIPSLSEFKDLEDEESKPSPRVIHSTEGGHKLFDLLPPPKAYSTEKSKAFVPHVLTKKITNAAVPQKTQSQNKKPPITKESKTPLLQNLISYDSNSEDEDESTKPASDIDFFSLSTPLKVSDDQLPPCDSLNLPTSTASLMMQEDKIEEIPVENTLRNNINNLSKNEIIIKNKVEVGPKLLVPEQEYNVDAKGNVALDEKAIEYLCGKRGVKRKNKDFDVADVIEINGEDIKPDEREWMIKALTEETTQRPVSLGAGPSSQSKRKHQITYLAHQAKAMELEVKNQWAQNKFTRQQTRSKYGF